jgi:hypothetical protein
VACGDARFRGATRASVNGELVRTGTTCAVVSSVAEKPSTGTPRRDALNGQLVFIHAGDSSAERAARDELAAGAPAPNGVGVYSSHEQPQQGIKRQDAKDCATCCRGKKG